MKVDCNYCGKKLDVMDIRIGISGSGHEECVLEEITGFAKRAKEKKE